ncbi:hypothetical protein MNBD_BACTEROID01-1168 [hydrothermal vent metagenome]|uniref:Uncharacterized protein n=2 Tax=hydrothermal vent metagenome TaxID=652676 RepID=A0A3B0TPE0_9ZZZZ
MLLLFSNALFAQNLSTGLTKAIKENIEYGNYHIVAAVKEVYNKAFSVNWGIIYTFAKKE